jgi:hypothetical protein
LICIAGHGFVEARFQPAARAYIRALFANRIDAAQYHVVELGCVELVAVAKPPSALALQARRP